jgi:hypothetical protein
MFISPKSPLNPYTLILTIAALNRVFEQDIVLAVHHFIADTW